MVLNGASLFEVRCVYNSWCLESMCTLSCLVTCMPEANAVTPHQRLSLVASSLIVVEPVA